MHSEILKLVDFLWLWGYLMKVIPEILWSLIQLKIITSVLKVLTIYFIISITAKLAVILMIVSVSTFKAAVILYLIHLIKAVEHIDISLPRYNWNIVKSGVKDHTWTILIYWTIIWWNQQCVCAMYMIDNVLKVLREISWFIDSTNQ